MYTRKHTTIAEMLTEINVFICEIFAFEKYIENAHIAVNVMPEVKQAAIKPNFGRSKKFKIKLIRPPQIVIPEFIFVFPLAVITVPYNIEYDDELIPIIITGT